MSHLYLPASLAYLLYHGNGRHVSRLGRPCYHGICAAGCQLRACPPTTKVLKEAELPFSPSSERGRLSDSGCLQRLSLGALTIVADTKFPRSRKMEAYSIRHGHGCLQHVRRRTRAKPHDLRFEAEPQGDGTRLPSRPWTAETHQ